MRRPTLQVTTDCNNACVFCAQRGTHTTVGELSSLQTRLASLRSTSDEVTFVGGEPTLVPSIGELIAEARRLGFTGIGLQTNGRRLSDRGQLARLVEAGLTDLHLSIHGADAAVHDYHTGVPSSLAEIRQTLSNARSLGLTSVANTVLSRSNYRVLTALPPFLAGNGVSAWLITVPRVAGALGAEDRITPRLTMGLQGVRQAVDAARKARLSVWIEGAPLCVLGPLAPFSSTEQPVRAYAPVCGTCPARANCPGVDPVYLERFQGDELVAREIPAQRFESPVTRLFVGIGELVPPRPAAPRPSTAGLVPLAVTRP